MRTTSHAHLPRTLIQLHYHNRTGGVTTVIGHYARAFAGMAGADATRNLFVCHATGESPSTGPARVISVPEFDYREYRSVAAYRRARDRMASRLMRLIRDPHLPRPVAVIGHNLTLGKNPALSSAFMHCARTGRDDDVRFYSMVHDFAEEGRLQLLRGIDRLDKAGADLLADLYSRAPNLRYLVLNPRDRAALASAGIRATVLPNPVDIDRRFGRLSGPDQAAVARALRSVAAGDGISLRTDAPWFFYPARIIGRKNVIESVLLACVILRGNLLVGVGGTTPADRRLYRRILRTCRTLRLPVVLDAPRIRGRLPRPLARENPFELLYRFCDACITTAVTEGFGYALFEPWLYGKTLSGRLPAGSDAQGTVDLTGLYRRLDVPAAWVSARAVSARYRGTLAEVAGHGEGRSHRSIEDELASRGTIDFAALDVESQIAVLERIVKGDAMPPAAARVWLRQCLRIIAASVRGDLIPRNRTAIRRELSSPAFQLRFRQLLAAPPPQPPRKVDPSAVRRFFARPEWIRLVMVESD